MKRMTSASFHPLRRGFAVAFGLGFLAIVPGCLLLSGRPINNFGEACSSDGDCASFGFCAAHSTYGNICLPKTAECASASDPVCGGYTCVLIYGAANAYCERSCNSSSDCVSPGFFCLFDAGSEGSCKPL
jgi:hypothetical protein